MEHDRNWCGHDLVGDPQLDGSRSTLTCCDSTCLPTIRQLFVRLFPALDGSSRTHQQYRKYGTAKELDGTKGRNSHSVRPGDSALSGMSKAYTGGGGIMVMSSFTVGRSGSDADDIILVERALPHYGQPI